MELAKYKACICEGSAENAIIDILLDNDLLIFTREEMLEEEVIRCRDGKRFEEKYLRKGFLEKISVIRILDSRRENFKLSKAYEQKVDVINVITAPEIEMLIIDTVVERSLASLQENGVIERIGGKRDGCWIVIK